MKICLVDIQSRKDLVVTKDLSGGYGTSSKFGESFFSQFLIRMKRRSVNVPTLSLGYLSAIFKNEGHEVEVLTNEKDLKTDTDLFLIYSSLIEHMSEMKFSRKIKKETSAKVGFIGTFASVMPDIFIPFSDFVIVEEPEEVVKKISKSGTIPKGLVKSSPTKDLNTLPFPDWTSFRYENFSYKHYLKESPTFPVLSSRGCPYSCAYYCPYPILEGKTVRLRHVENVVEELEYLKSTYKAKGFLFRDPIFTLYKQRTAELAELMIKRGINTPWVCETHLDQLDTTLIDLMYTAGLRGINVGVESANEEVLKSSKRKAKGIEHQERIIRYCEKKGIKIGAFYIFGALPDTETTIQETINYAKKLNTSFAQFTLCTPYPGTKFYDDIKDQITETDWEKFDIYTPTFTHPNFTHKRLQKLKEKAFFEYYFRPTWIWKTLKRYSNET